MMLPRFFCAADFQAHTLLELPEDVGHHIRVRRLRVGDSLTLFDGKGHQARATLEHLERASARVQIVETQSVTRELPGNITLVQAITQQDKLDLVIEKATELGVHQLIVTTAQRSVVRLDAQRAQRRALHCQRIIESASAQCGRNQLMHLQMPLSLAQTIDLCQHQPILAFMPGTNASDLNEPTLLDLIQKHQACAIFIGPEGGWSSSEEKQLLDASAVRASLGPRVLRTETAGLAAVASLTALLGWNSNQPSSD